MLRSSRAIGNGSLVSLTYTCGCHDSESEASITRIIAIPNNLKIPPKSDAMDQMLNTKLDEVEQSLIETYELALAYGDEASKSSVTFENIYADLLKIRNDALRDSQALQKAKEQSTLEELEAEYTSELKKSNKNFQAKKTKEHKAFQARLIQFKQSIDGQTDAESGENRTTHVECDEMIMETQVQVIDPLTKRRMENPMKNKICGHHYEMSSILEAIKINRRLRCPVAGCGNNNFIQRDHLVNDDKLKIYIMNLKNDSDDDDEDPLL